MSTLTNLISSLRDSNIEKASKVTLLYSTCKDNSWIKEILKYTYDPFKQFFIKSKFPDFIDTSNNFNILDFNEELWNQTIKVLLDKLNRRLLNTKTYTEELKTIMSSLSKENQDILKCIITKDLKIGFAAKSINNAIKENLISTSLCQLCKTWDPTMKVKNIDYWWCSRKLNGLRGRWLKRDNEYTFLTREDYPLVGFDSITSELKYLQEKYDLELIDGEVFNFNLPFQSIMSVARGEKTFDPKQKDLLIFHIFNIQRNNYTYKDTEEMIGYIKDVFSKESNTLTHIVPLEYEKVNNTPDDIINKTIQYTHDGYEGIVLRDPTISWEGGKRNNHLLKYKLFFETDLTIKDILYGEVGKKWENYITALYCEGIIKAKKITIGNDILYQPVAKDENSEDTEYIEVPIRVKATTSDWTDDERKAYTKHSKDYFIDRIGEIKFQTITDKPDSTGYYSLQFPVFQKFKDLN